MAGVTSRTSRSARDMRVASVLLLLCGAVLFFDVGGELHMALLYPASLSGFVWVHLASEVLASLGLGWAFVLTRRAARRAESARQDQSQMLTALRGDFDALMRQRFAEWGLSPAEVDIALLSVRGLKISEIAALRETREGTIKAQLSSIFRKSDVSTRTEFLARFIDEFLDLGAQPGDTHERAPASGSGLDRAHDVLNDLRQ